MPGVPEMLICGAIAVLLFGSRLPSVARNLGSSIMNFKKGFKEAELEVIELERKALSEASDMKTTVQDTIREAQTA